MSTDRRKKQSIETVEQLAKRWPSLRYIGLGIILSWIHVEADFVSQLAAVGPDRSIMTGNGIWLYLGMLLAYLVFSLMSRSAMQLFDRRGARFLVLALCIIGAGLLIAASPGLSALGATGVVPPRLAHKAIFALGVTLLGIVEAMTLIQCARLYLFLRPSEMIFFTLLSQLVVFVLYNVLNSYSAYLVWPSGPSYSGLLGMILLPFLAWCLMALPNAQPMTAVEQERESQRVLSPSFLLLLLTIFVITCVVSTTLNALMGIRPPSDYLFDAQLAMLIRFLIVLVLLAVCVVFSKRFPLDKFFRVCTVVIAIAPALMLLFGVSTSILVLVITETLFLLDLLIWILLILAVRETGEDAPRLFSLGMAVACAGIFLGSILGSIDAVGVLLSENRFSGACFTALVLLLSVLLFNERRILVIMGSSGEDTLNISSVLDKPTVEASPTQKARLWEQACRNVGERAMLSEREQELLRLLSVNRSPQDIADTLSISLHTVRTHTRNIYAKMGVHSRDELITTVREERERLR